jgi:transcriptional regulator with XRE-family HTH domain
MRVAQQIRKLRLDRGWSQGELAERAGMKQPVLSRLENISNEMMTIRSLEKIAKALNVELKVEFVPRNLECGLLISPNSLGSVALLGLSGTALSGRATKRLSITNDERWWERRGIL